MSEQRTVPIWVTSKHIFQNGLTAGNIENQGKGTGKGCRLLICSDVSFLQKANLIQPGFVPKGYFSERFLIRKVFCRKYRIKNFRIYKLMERYKNITLTLTLDPNLTLALTLRFLIQTFFWSAQFLIRTIFNLNSFYSEFRRNNLFN